MSYKIMDGGLCAIKEIDTVSSAKSLAEKYVNEFVFKELELIEIVNEQTNEVVSSWDPTLVWEDFVTNMYGKPNER